MLTMSLCLFDQVTYPHEDASLAGAFQPSQLPHFGASAMRLLGLVLPQRTRAQLAQLLASPTQGCLAALKAAGWQTHMACT